MLLLGSPLLAQNIPDSCLLQAQERAQNPEKGSYQPFLSCALKQAQTQGDSLAIYYEVGRRLYRSLPADAHLLLDTAIFLSQESDIRKGRSWQYKAYLFEINGQFIPAEQAYSLALANYEQVQAPPLRIASCAKSLGNIYTRFADYEKAISYLQKAVDNFRAANDHSLLAMTLSDLSKAYYWEGEVEKASKQAKEVMTLPSLSDLELGLAKENLGACLLQQKAYPQGILMTHEAIRHFLAIDFLEAAAEAYRLLGETYTALGQIDSAKSAFQRAAIQAKKAYGNQTRREVGQWYIGWGNVLMQEKNWDGALQSFQQALYHCLPGVIDTLDPRKNFSPDQIYRENVFIQALEGKAKCWREKYLQQAKQNYLHAVIDALDLLYATEDKFRKSYDFESSRLRVGASRHPRVEMSLWAISQLKDKEKYIERAFAYVESSKALGLLEELKNDQSRQSVLPKAAAFQWRVQEVEIRELEMSLGHAPNDSLRDLLRELRFRQAQFIDSLEQLYPDYYQFKYNYASVTSDQMIHKLPHKSSLIEYFYGDAGVYAFKLSASGLELYQLGEPGSLTAAIDILERSLRSTDPVSPAQYAQAAYQLYQHLLGPLGELSARLVIVPDRALARIPFDALVAQLPDSPKSWQELPYLIYDKSIAYAWSATLLHALQQQPKEGKGIFSLAPVFYQHLPHLTAGKSLGPHLQSLWPQTELLQEEAATKNNFLQHLQQREQPFRILNLYTHAKADSLASGRSWISFRDDQPEPLLYLSELYHLQLDAELAVLGACETGIGKEYRGEGLMSFARGFAYAGCQSILSTLWSSDEQATAQLLQDFFSKLKAGEAKDLALADSKRDFLAASSARTALDYHPRQWASLMVVGDAQAMFSGAFAWLIAGLAVLVLILIALYFVLKPKLKLS